MGSVAISALRGVDLRIREGEFVAIWGPSGSGKSTLCNLAGLLDECSDGAVLFRGVETTALTDNQRSELRNDHIGFIFQSFNLIPVFTALENVLLPLQLRGTADRAAHHRARSAACHAGPGSPGPATPRRIIRRSATRSPLRARSSAIPP
ncbi:MAG: ATP-binding cassette domain-containing protein [Candidatus Competibacteraceae bacterium]